MFIYLLDFIYRGSFFRIFTTLIYHKVLINNKTEQDTEQECCDNDQYATPIYEPFIHVYVSDYSQTLIINHTLRFDKRCIHTYTTKTSSKAYVTKETTISL